jgi:hypothetical protein
MRQPPPARLASAALSKRDRRAKVGRAELDPDLPLPIELIRLVDSVQGLIGAAAKGSGSGGTGPTGGARDARGRQPGGGVGPEW